MENENTVQQFLNDNFGEVRTVLNNGEIWFIGKDICDILGTKTKDLRTITKNKGIDTIDILTNGGKQEVLCINETSLYKIIFKSRKPFAEEFQDWICEVVVPSIRKDGGYIDKEEKVTTGEMSEDELIYKAMQMMDKKIHRLEEEKLLLEKENGEMKPIVSLVDKFVNTNNCYDIGTYAKILESKELGRTRLFAWLKDKKILMSNNVPYQAYTKYFKVIPVINQWTGQTNYKTLLKPIGITYIYNKLLKDGKVIEKPLEKVIEDLAPAV